MRTTTGVLRLLGLAAAVLVTSSTHTAAETQQPAPMPQTQQRDQAGTWARDAEETLGLGHGVGPRLLSETEWREHQQKMRSMTAEERERYRAEVHAQMVERARERGVALPTTPRGPMSGQPGPGMGQGPGMGTGGGMGQDGGGMGSGGGGHGGGGPGRR